MQIHSYMSTHLLYFILTSQDTLNSLRKQVEKLEKELERISSSSTNTKERILVDAQYNPLLAEYQSLLRMKDSFLSQNIMLRRALARRRAQAQALRAEVPSQESPWVIQTSNYNFHIDHMRI